MSSRKRLLIVGAGGFGREVCDYAQVINPLLRDWDLGGFLDSNPAALAGFSQASMAAVLGDPQTYCPAANDVFVCAIGDPATKLRLGRELLARGANFVNLMHPTSFRGSNFRFGVGCILGPYAGVTTGGRIGDFVTINGYSSVGHDAVIGDGCTLSGHCDVTGFAVLGQGVFMGSHSCVLPNVKVGDFARIGAASAVVKRVPAHSTVMGVPAKLICTRNADTVSVTSAP